jgi:hypothetical protein
MTASNKRILPDMAAMAARLAALEAENEALKAGTKATQVAIVEKHGKPFLEFKGNFVPYAFSVQKCQRIADTFQAIEAFAKSDGKKTA